MQQQTGRLDALPNALQVTFAHAGAGEEGLPVLRGERLVDSE
jgi:hypothetical protein